MAKKALIYADLHSHTHKGLQERLQHCVDVQDWVFRVAEEKQVDYIWFLGDLFHETEKIDVLNYLRTYECFMKHMIDDAHDRDVFLLVGNHDMYLRVRWDINSVKPFSAIPRVQIVDKPISMKMGGRQIDWMPHTENPIKEIDSLKSLNGQGDILLGHMAIHGALLNTYHGTKSDTLVEYDNGMVPVDVKIFDGYKKVFLGHYHGAQHLNDHVEYVGSPLQLTFGEAFQQKHVIILNLETLEKEYVVNDFSPQHLIISPDDVRHDNYDLTGKFVRLVQSSLGRQEISDLKMDILKKHQVLSLDVKEKEKNTAEDQTIIADARSILTDPNRMVDTWVKMKGVPDGLDEKRLIEKGQLCLQPCLKKTSS